MDDEQNSKRFSETYQTFLSKEAMIGPVPASFWMYLAGIIIVSIFFTWALLLLIIVAGFFSFLSKKGMDAGELKRFLLTRFFGLTNTLIRHINRV